MIIDELLEFADATALDTSGTNTDLIGDVIDLGSTPQDYGNGEALYLVLRVTSAVTSGGSATVQFHLASDAQAAIAVDGSASYHWSSPAVPVASLVAGYKLVVAVPVGVSVPYERYLGLLTTTGTAALTGGAVDAYLTLNPGHLRTYPDAVN